MHEVNYRWVNQPSLFRMEDPGDGKAIIPDRGLCLVPLKSGASAETRTLPAPNVEGQRLTLQFQADGGGDITITASASVTTGNNTTLVFANAGEMAELVAINKDGSLVWRLVGMYLGQGAALTAQLTAITHTAPGTPDYAIQNLTNSSPYGFATQDEGNTVLSVIANLQTRLAEVEARLEALRLVAAN